jgi:hypothetical protein
MPCSGLDSCHVNKGNSCMIKCLDQLCVSVILYLSETILLGEKWEGNIKIHFMELVRMGGRSS